MQIIRDSEIEFFLQKLINNIIKHSDKKSKILYPRLISNNDYNAFVTGTNKIYVNTGLINQAHSIDEIQGVLAHEIGHLFLKHHNSRLINRKNSSRYSKIATAAGIALTLAGKLDPTTATGLIIGGQDLGIKSYLQFSRIQETQADNFALEVIKKSKISYLGLEYLLNRLSEEQFLSKNSQSNYYRSHPVSQSRLEQFKRYKNKFLEKQKEKKPHKIKRYRSENQKVSRGAVRLDASKLSNSACIRYSSLFRSYFQPSHSRCGFLSRYDVAHTRERWLG